MSVEVLTDAREKIEYCLLLLNDLPPEIAEIDAHNFYIYLKWAKRNLCKLRFLLGGEAP